MCDTGFDTGFLGNTQNNTAEGIHMGVDDGVFGVFFEKMCKLMGVLEKTYWFERIDDRIDSATQSVYFIVEKPFFATVCEKVELNPGTVDMAVEVHQQCLDAAPVHNADNVKYSDRMLHGLFVIL
jgi:hypothetical protein